MGFEMRMKNRKGLDCSTNILMSLIYECDNGYTKENFNEGYKKLLIFFFIFHIKLQKITEQRESSKFDNFLFLQKNIKSLKVDKLLLIIDSTKEENEKIL